MRFTLDVDDGHSITGWVAPDNPLAVSRVRVSVEGQTIIEVPATEYDHGVRANGWHSSGLCRFVLNEQVIPGLSAIPDLEIHDVDTNVLVHRRCSQPLLCDKKVALINTSINPDTVLQSSLYGHFQKCYFNVEKFPEETLSLILSNPFSRSIFSAGSLLIPRYESDFHYGEVLSILLVQDPCIEMATRMLWLRNRQALADDHTQSWRLGDLIEAVRFAGDFDFDDVKSLKRFFRMLPEAAYRLLFNPLTRQLGTRLPDDRIFPANSIIAVEVLSRVGIVGHRDYYEAFVASVFDGLGITVPPPPPTSVPNEVLALADRLRGLKVASTS